MPVLLGLGVRTLSISPARLGEIKRQLAGLRMEDMERMAREVLAMSSQEEVLAYLEKQLGSADESA